MREFSGSNPCPEAILTDEFHGYLVRLNKSAYNNYNLENKHIFHSTDKLYEVQGKDK
jgi:hypothetical protein